MKRKDLTTLREKKLEELKKMVNEKKIELTKVHLNLVSGKEKNVKKARNLKIEIAQILTIIGEGQLSDKEKKVE